ncbi:MAG TPA: cell division protein ZapA [Beijerinckiaceae bacterium]|jgi:cell division protein ZapA
MPQITVNIAGRSYRMACGEGEEKHLEGLAALLDGKVEEMRGAFGEIGDMRLHVMAAITIADEFAETRRKLAAAEEEIAVLRSATASEEERRVTREALVAEGLNRVADRVERLARGLSAAPSGTA